jgi:hypothetical protein
MLHQINSRSQDCYRHADKARQRALACRDPVQRGEFLEMAERWLKQARCYEGAKWTPTSRTRSAGRSTTRRTRRST